MDYRSQIKAYAKERLSSQYGTTLGACFLALLPPLFLILIPFVFTTLLSVAAFLKSLTMVTVLLLLLYLSLPFVTIGIFLLMPFSTIGIPAFMLSAVRGVREKSTYPYTSCKNYGKKLGGVLWMILFLFLWSLPYQFSCQMLGIMIVSRNTAGIVISSVCTLLLIIPAIIKAFSYSFHPYILADCPNLTVRQALKLSKKMTKGIKGELFVFELSFIGWWFLTSLTGGILAIYTVPYYCMAKATLYESMKNSALARGKITEVDLDPTLVYRNENYSQN